MIGLLGPIIKAGLIGGGSVACVYGVYKLAIDISSTDYSDQGFDIFSNLNSSSQHLNLKNLKTFSNILQNPNAAKILNDKNSMDDIKQIMTDPNKQEIVGKVLEGCTSDKNKSKITCKDLSQTLSTIVNKLSDNTDSPSKQASSAMSSFFAVSKEDIMNKFKSSSADKLIHYLDDVSLIEKTKTAFSKTSVGWVTNNIGDSLTAIYTWWQFPKYESVAVTPAPAA